MSSTSSAAPSALSSSSSLGTATEHDIRGLLAGLYRDKNHKRGILVLRAQPRWDGPPVIEVEDLDVPIHACSTVLHLRDVIRHRHDPDVPWRVILTDLRDDEIPQGVKEHFQPVGRTLELDPTRTLLGLFSAARARGRLPHRPDDVRGLVALLSAHRDALEPTPTPALTADHLYAALARHVLGLPENVRLPEVLAWSATPGADAAWRQVVESVGEQTRDHFLAWVTRGFSLTGTALRALWAGRGPATLLPAGVVAETLSGTGTLDETSHLTIPRVLFRKHVGTLLNDDALRDWGRAAATAVRSELEAGHTLTTVIADAAALLADIDEAPGSPLLGASTVLPGGFQRRLDRFARALSRVVEGSSEGPALLALSDMREHVDAGRAYAADIETAASLIRLLRWHRTTADTTAELMRTATIAAAMDHYATDVSWVDRAVNTAWRGFSADPTPAAGHATVDPDHLVRAILDRVLDARRGIDRSFAALAAATLTTETKAGKALLVEDVLDRVITPLRQSGPPGQNGREARPLLVLVIDGLSMAAAHALHDDISTRHGTVWQNLDLPSLGLHVAASTLPSVTTYSRTSLLTGELAAGGQSEEKAGFTTTNSAWPLFHKGELDAGIGDMVRQTIYDTERAPVVGAVLNTVDDALDRSDPITTTWTTQRVTHLDKLLEYARAVGRDVVLLSDHGHVVERSQISKTDVESAVSARWRPADGSPVADSEREVSGPRVLAPGGTAILAVDEDVRYTGKKAGYHGGLAPAEVCAPVAVLVQSLDGLEGSPFPVGVPVTDRWPGWWDLEAGVPDPGAAPAALQEQSTLFDAPDTVPAPEAKKTSDLYTRLSRNTRFKDAVAAHRVDLAPAEFAGALRAIDHNNGRMPMAGLGTHLRLSSLRLRGTLSRMQKVVNVDGMPTLEIDGNDVVLRPELLRSQFVIE